MQRWRTRVAMAMFATKAQEAIKNACRSGHVVCCTSYAVGDTLTVGRPFIYAYIHHIVIFPHISAIPFFAHF